MRCSFEINNRTFLVYSNISSWTLLDWYRLSARSNIVLYFVWIEQSAIFIFATPSQPESLTNEQKRSTVRRFYCFKAMYIECGNMSVWTIFAMLITQETHSMISKYTHRAINGYYCASGYIMNHTETEHQRCVAHSITSPSCWVLSYNLRGKYCLLGAEPCVVTAASSDFRVMIFRTLADVSDVSKSPCISWRWYDGTEYPSRTVEEFTPWHSAMARKQRGSEIHIATCSPSSGWIWLPSGGNMLTLYRDCDLLVVS